MIVVDASALAELLLNTAAGPRVGEALFADDETIHAPHLLDVEIAQVLRRYVRSREIDADQGRQALQILADFPLTRYPHDLLLNRVWELRHNMTAYDAVYVALAEALDAPLLTRDAALAGAGGHNATIRLV